MKISLAINSLAIHGSVRRCIGLANALTQHGHDTTIYCELGQPCHWLKSLAPVQPISALCDRGHDAVVLMTNSNLYRHWIDQAETGLKLFYLLGLDERNLNAIKTEGLGQQGKTFFRRIIRDNSWAIAANSTWMYEWVKDNLRPDCKLLLGGIDRSIFHPVPGAKGKLSTLSTGAIREREGSATVKAALSIVLKKYPKLRINTYDKRGYPQSEMARVYASATVFIDGQHYAGWNNAVIEAMACGTAVACTDIGGVEDFAFHEETALLSPVEDAGPMAENVLRLLGDEALRERLQEAAYRTSLRFDWDRTVEEFERIVKGEWQ